MRKLLFLLLISAIITISQPVSSYRVPLWDGTKYIWPILGPAFVLSGNVLNVAPVVAKVRIYDVRLTFDPVNNNFKFPSTLPTDPTKIQCWVNGLLEDDYTVQSRILILNPVRVWPLGSEIKIVCNYDI